MDELVTVAGIGELEKLAELAVVVVDEPPDAGAIVFVETVLDDEEVLEAAVEVGVE